jgi:hypothetical protein
MNPLPGVGPSIPSAFFPIPTASLLTGPITGR